MTFLPISFALFLLASLVVTVTADADYLDVEDWEAPVNLTNGKVVVEFYTVADQCQPQPGYQRLLINQLLFYLPKEGVCRDGFLICYYGQLGKEMLHLGHGLIPSIPYRMGNIRNNEVTKRCDKLRTQVLLECEDDSRKCIYLADAPGKKLNSSWHGMLLRTDEDGNIIVQLSTSKESFKVPRSEFGEWLSLKLASFKDKTSFFSRDTDRKDGAELEEHRNQINLKNDVELWKEYAKQRRKGAFLKKYAGIWSLGLDMLPTEAQDDEDGFWLYIQSPECCELKGWFLTPSAVKPEIPKKETIPQKIDFSGVKINDSFKLEFEGRMDAEAEKMEIIFEAKYNHSADLLQGFNWYVDVVKQKATFSEELFVNGEYTPEKKAENTSNLVPGMLFNMNITFYTDHLVLEVKANCSSSTLNFTLGKPINFEDYFDFKMHGDFVLYGEVPIFENEPKTTTTRSTSSSSTTTIPTTTTTMTTVPPFKPGEGFIVRGKIPESNTNGFSLVFKREIPEDSSYVIALNLEVLLQVNKILLFKEEYCYTPQVECVDKKRKSSDVLDLEKFPKSGDNFEIFFFCNTDKRETGLFEYKLNLELHIWVQDKKKLWNFNYEHIRDDNAIENNKFNFIFEAPIFQPDVGILGIAESGDLTGLGYRKTINMANTANGKALEIRAKQFGHGLQDYTEKFAFYFTYTGDDDDRISVQFDEDGNSKMWLEYMKIDRNFAREEVSSKGTIHLNEDFTIRFGIRGDNWFDVSVNGKLIKSVEVYNVAELRTLYIVSIATKQDGTVLQQFPLKKGLKMVYRGGLALLAEPDFK